MDYKDINSDLCVKCGACCKVSLAVNVQQDTRSFEYYKAVGLNIELVEDNKNMARVNFGDCQHLDTSEGLYKCKIYDSRPQLCRDFNCLAWASCTNIKDKSEFLKHATQVYNEMNGTNI